MADISTAIQLIDQMTAPILAIANCVNNLANRLYALDNSVSLQPGAMSAVHEQVNLADAAEQLNNTVKALEGCINQMKRGQDDFNDTDKLQNNIFPALQRPPGDYLLSDGSISKPGIMAESTFSRNYELITFSEYLSNQSSFANKNADTIESTMYNLTQTLSSNILRTGDPGFVLSNAQLVIQTIADYTDYFGYTDYFNVPTGQIKDLAQECQITAAIAENTLLWTADETNAAFDKVPVSFEAIAAQTLMISQPALQKLNNFVSNPEFQSFLAAPINASAVILNRDSESLESFANTAVFQTFALSLSLCFMQILEKTASDSQYATTAHSELNSDILDYPISGFVFPVTALIYDLTLPDMYMAVLNNLSLPADRIKSAVELYNNPAETFALTTIDANYAFSSESTKGIKYVDDLYAKLELGMGGNLFAYRNDDIALNALNINTAESVPGYSEEELKLWQNIAERETVNEFTTAEVYIDFGGIVNNVSSEMDLDGIVEYIGEHVEERLLEVAEGVHT